MTGHVVEQALPLLAAANNHGDVAVKLSSLKQVKDIIISSDPYMAVDLFPYLVDLKSSPETLVRKYLLEVIEAIVKDGLAHSSILMSILLTLLKDHDPLVAKQAIATGTTIFCSVLEELTLQFHRRLIVERWLDELWMWMVKFKDSVHSLLFEDGPTGPKLLAVKFLEINILLFTDDANDNDKRVVEDHGRHIHNFNISWLVGRHPVLDPAVLSVDAKRTFNLLMDLLQSSGVPALLTISTINSLAIIARKRPVHYSNVLSALFELNSNFEVSKRGHTVSIQYSIRNALLGFLKCSHPIIWESRERLLKALRAMDAGEAADHVIRQVEKMMRNYERASRDAQSNKDEQVLDCPPPSRSLTKNIPLPTDREDLSTSNDIDSERIRYFPNHFATSMDDFGLNLLDGVSPMDPLLDVDLTPVAKMIAMIGGLIAEGEKAVESLEILISTIHPDMLADIIITNMKHLPANPPPLTTLSNLSLYQSNYSSGADPVVRSVYSPIPLQIPVTTTEIQISSLSDMSSSIDSISDIKRDPRRDPRRLGPRRSAPPVGVNNDYFGSTFEYPPNSTTELNASTVQPVP